MSHATTIDKPFFMYDPVTETESEDPQASGVQIMSIDNLPCELALESSKFFSTALFPHGTYIHTAIQPANLVLNMLKNKFDSDAILARSIITNSDGTLADAHKGLKSAIKKAASLSATGYSPLHLTLAVPRKRFYC